MVSTVNETKTPSELVEWLRLWANGYEDGDALDDNDARQIADAVERVCAPCNAAAMREALENVERVARFCAETPRHTPGYPTDAARADVLYSRIVELGRVARAALAAPARNCDRFQTGDRLTDAVSALNAYANEEEHEPVRRWNESDWRRFLDWLFAPAKEGKEARRG